MKTATFIVLFLMFFAALPAMAEPYETLPLRDVSQIADRFYTNPSEFTGIGDPCILPCEDAYYAFSTSSMPNKFYAWSALNPAAFRKTKNVTLALKPLAWADIDYWAPRSWCGPFRGQRSVASDGWRLLRIRGFQGIFLAWE